MLYSHVLLSDVQPFLEYPRVVGSGVHVWRCSLQCGGPVNFQMCSPNVLEDMKCLGSLLWFLWGARGSVVG
jgi:hypothetical protein